MEKMISRRAVVGGAAALSLAHPAHAASALNATTLTAPEQRMAVYARIRGGVSGGPALWWISATIYAKQNNQPAVALFGVTGASINTITPRADGGLMQTMEEAGYFTDLNTGAILTRWVNPVTKAEATPEPYKMKTTQGIAPSGEVERPKAPFPVEVTGGLSTVQTNGDTVWVEENFSARVALLSPAVEGKKPDIIPGQFRVIDSHATFQARIADVLGPEKNFVPATIAFQETDPWFGWMAMGDVPGLQLWNLKGRKLRGPDELPATLRTRLRADYPGFV